MFQIGLQVCIKILRNLKFYKYHHRSDPNSANPDIPVALVCLRQHMQPVKPGTSNLIAH